ncbi:phthalate 4,5-dioxygenase, reductase subunit [Noviherbaspirillum humi]|uniref:Phthalate 4,5-dioxygenase, reductase subunit n=1 Tax=Noviherbaspirillum humi TaxID=1688639 RepID=A0A239F0J0_9BURK|nr:PDR/VanB family oxidoreductase [Noviherbaspirillum humi]SNS50520.1 phthalate 4,5-dioxygenase, reductase subunit [Noviherbaspirillum humi]
MEAEETDEIMMPLRIASIVDLADGIRSFELVHPDGAELPPFTPGSHVKVRTPNGAIRKYSLCNDPAEGHRYVIAVKRDANGRGGSLSIVDDAKQGDTLPTSPPENAFPLKEGAPGYVFIAGGIGITPILSMIRSFGDAPPAPWKLYYLTRSPQSTAFLDELAQPRYKGKVVIHHDGGDAMQAYDLWPVLEKPGRTHVYCCGPQPLMDAVRDMSGHWNPGNIHFESFNDGGKPRPDDKPFTVRLAGSNEAFEVPVGETILSVLKRAGHRIPSSCESGSCGTCKTRLVAGVADHRDMVLMPEEGDTHIMVCVSRAKSDEITVELPR